jgi:hypothetical protein
MANYPVHTMASAPAESKPALEQLQKAFGILPNLPAVIANSPKLINSLMGMFQQVHSPGFTEAENQIVLSDRRSRELLQICCRIPHGAGAAAGRQFRRHRRDP